MKQAGMTMPLWHYQYVFGCSTQTISRIFDDIELIMATKYEDDNEGRVFSFIELTVDVRPSVRIGLCI